MKTDGGFIREEYEDEKVSIYVIDIRELDENLKNTINQFIVSICEGPQETLLELEDVKEEIRRFLTEKKPKNNETGKETNTYIGAIAEFFIHLFLNYIGLKQECLFLNLEEKSIKKGFDGYYSFNGETWIMESKSGYINSQNATHKEKLKTSYKQLKDKITTNDPKVNNPWKNALRHAQIAQSDKNILKELQKFSQQFIRKEINNDINNFNLIPCSTIYYFKDWEENKENIINEIKHFISELEYRKLKIICINKKFKKLFLNYLGDRLMDSKDKNKTNTHWKY